MFWATPAGTPAILPSGSHLHDVFGYTAPPADTHDAVFGGTALRFYGL
jgi:hypothetical protein